MLLPPVSSYKKLNACWNEQDIDLPYVFRGKISNFRLILIGLRRYPQAEAKKGCHFQK
jgi:hypothetical protein